MFHAVVAIPVESWRPTTQTQSAPRRHHTYIGYPPSWIVRFLKLSLLVLPFLSMFFGLLFMVLLMDVDPSKPHLPALSDEKFTEFIEKNNICNKIDYSGIPANSTNSTAVRLRTICEQLKDMDSQYYRKRDRKVNPYTHSFLISASGVCSSRTDVIVLIHSLHDYYDRRKAIRETWGGAVRRKKWPSRTIEEDVRIAFVFGRHHNRSLDTLLEWESGVYGDIIQGDFFEHYHNMTLKSLLGLKWVSRYCPSAKVLIKSDDDMILNFPPMLALLRQTNHRKWTIMGPHNVGSKVYRKGSKWSLSKDLYPFYYFPPYESGSAYMITADLVAPLFEASEYVPHIFIDDVYITGILGKILGVNHITKPGFAFWTNKPPKVCALIKDEIMTGTRIKPQVQYGLWRELLHQPDCRTTTVKKA